MEPAGPTMHHLQSEGDTTLQSPSQASALEEPDMLSEVLSRLDLVELVRAGSVCKAWHSISGADNKALWRALAQRGVAWEAEEGRQPGAWLPHEQPQFPPTVGEYKWMPTARFEHMRRSNVMELMRNPALRAQVAGEAVTQRAADPSSPKEAVMASGLRQHAERMVRLLKRWAAEIRATDLEDVVESSAAYSTPTFPDDGLEFGISVVETAPLRELLLGTHGPALQQGANGEKGRVAADRISSTDLPPEGALREEVIDEERGSVSAGRSEVGEGGIADNDITRQSPRKTFPCNFICTAAQILDQQRRDERVRAMVVPPAPRRPRRVRLADARPRASLNSARRVLRFGEVPRREVDSPPLAPSTPTPAGSSRKRGTQWGSPGPVGQPFERADEQLTSFAARCNFTKFVDLLGTLNHSSDLPADPNVQSFIQKVVVQVEYRGLEVRIMHSFGWHHTSAQWTATRSHPPGDEEGSDGTAGVGAAPLAIWANAGGGIAVTQLEHRYAAQLTVSVRRAEDIVTESNSSSADEGNSGWRELLHVSQHTGREFVPEETARLRHEGLRELASEWCLGSLSEKQLLRLLVALGGRQPVEMASILRHLFRTLDPALSTVCARRRRNDAKDRSNPVADIGAEEIHRPAAGIFCESCDGECFEARLLSDLPRLLCMTDTSLLDDISWVVALGQRG